MVVVKTLAHIFAIGAVTFVAADVAFALCWIFGSATGQLVASLFVAFGSTACVLALLRGEVVQRQKMHE